MPLDELLKLYGQNSSIIHSKPQADDEVIFYSKIDLI